MADNNEKDVSTQQSPTQTDSRLSRPHGNARRTQRAEAAAHQGPCQPDSISPAQAAGLAGEKRRGFSAANRLRRRAEFMHVQRHGLRLQTSHFVLFAAKYPGPDGPRLGMAVSRRVGKAVVRNRLRRRIREHFRLSLRRLVPDGCALVVIARAGAAELATPSINTELETATLRLAQRLRERRGDETDRKN